MIKKIRMNFLAWDAGLPPNSINRCTRGPEFFPLPSIQRLLIFRKQLVVYCK